MNLLIYDRRRAEPYKQFLAERGYQGQVWACSTPTEAEAVIDQVEAIWAWGFPVALAERAPRLRWIQTLSAGVNDWLGAVPQGVVLTRILEVFGPRMAEYVLAHLLADTQRLRQLYEAQVDREWRFFVPGLLRGKRVGIAGLGEIGSEVARLLRAVGLTVRGLSRRPPAPDLVDEWFSSAEKEAFLSGLDYLVLVLPLTPATAGFLDATALAALPADCLVINVGRGPLIDEGALLAALQAGRLRGAVLDVFAQEPLPAEHPLWQAPGVTITPHLSAPSVPEEVFEQAWANLQRFLKGEPLRGVVDLELGY